MPPNVQRFEAHAHVMNIWINCEFKKINVFVKISNVRTNTCRTQYGTCVHKCHESHGNDVDDDNNNKSLTPCAGYVSQPQSPDIEDVSRRFTAKTEDPFRYLYK